MQNKQAPSIKRKKPYGAIAIIAAAAVLLAIMPGLARRDKGGSDSIVSFEATGGTIETSVHAGGTLTDRQAAAVTIPDGIELDFAVKNGDYIKKGDLIATADRTGLMQAIASLQEKMDEIDDEIETAMDEADSSRITATASGRVKAVYVQEGQSVTDAMYRSGALVLLSLDGHMAVDVYYPQATVGMQVNVELSDGKVVTGTVAALSGDYVTVTISDKEGELDEQVSLTDKKGKEIGSGKLYINSQLAVTGYYGTIDDLRVDVDDWVDSGDVIATLTDVGASAGYAGLLNHRRAMEEQLQSLFEMYHTGGIYAETDGIIAEVNEKDFTVEDTRVSGGTAVPMTNSPTGEEGYTNYAAKLVSFGDGTVNLLLCPLAFSNPDYANVALLEQLPYTESINNYTIPDGTPIYSYIDGGWTGGSAAVGNYLIFAFNITEEAPPQLVWIVSHQPPVEEEQPGTDPEDPDTPDNPDNPNPDNPDPDVPDNPDNPDNPDTPDDPDNPDTPDNPEVPDIPGGTDPTVPGIPNIPGGTIPSMPEFDFQMPEFDYSFSDYAGAFSGTMMPENMMPQAQESKWLLTELNVCSITADTDMTVTLSIDEADLSYVSRNMEVQLKLDALPGESFTAIVTDIADSSETTYGSAKYAVEITLDRTAMMRAGMNAAVTIPVESRQVACALPLAALTEQNGQTVVYMSYNEDDGVFADPVIVTTGLSDGNMVEILSGVNAGDTVYYEYVEVMDYSFI